MACSFIGFVMRWLIWVFDDHLGIILHISALKHSTILRCCEYMSLLVPSAYVFMEN